MPENSPHQSPQHFRLVDRTDEKNKGYRDNTWGVTQLPQSRAQCPPLASSLSFTHQHPWPCTTADPQKSTDTVLMTT